MVGGRGGVARQGHAHAASGPPHFHPCRFRPHPPAGYDTVRYPRHDPVVHWGRTGGTCRVNRCAGGGHHATPGAAGAGATTRPRAGNWCRWAIHQRPPPHPCTVAHLLSAAAARQRPTRRRGPLNDLHAPPLVRPRRRGVGVRGGHPVGQRGSCGRGDGWAFFIAGAVGAHRPRRRRRAAAAATAPRVPLLHTAATRCGGGLPRGRRGGVWIGAVRPAGLTRGGAQEHRRPWSPFPPLPRNRPWVGAARGRGGCVFRRRVSRTSPPPRRACRVLPVGRGRASLPLGGFGAAVCSTTRPRGGVGIAVAQQSSAADQPVAARRLRAVLVAAAAVRFCSSALFG